MRGIPSDFEQRVARDDTPVDGPIACAPEAGGAHALPTLWNDSSFFTAPQLKRAPFVSALLPKQIVKAIFNRDQQNSN